MHMYTTHKVRLDIDFVNVCSCMYVCVVCVCVYMCMFMSVCIWPVVWCVGVSNCVGVYKNN